LGERLNGIQEVRGSIPLGSTIPRNLKRFVRLASRPAVGNSGSQTKIARVCPLSRRQGRSLCQGNCALERFPLRSEQSCGSPLPGQPSDQTIRPIGLEVPSDCVELLPEIAHHPAGAAHIRQFSGDFERRQLASCYLVFRSHRRGLSCLRVVSQRHQTRFHAVRPPRTGGLCQVITVGGHKVSNPMPSGHKQSPHLPPLQDQPRDHPPGGDDVCPIPTVIAERRGPAARARHRQIVPPSRDSGFVQAHSTSSRLSWFLPHRCCTIVGGGASPSVVCCSFTIKGAGRQWPT
jgi:hypothetical protein